MEPGIMIMTEVRTPQAMAAMTVEKTAMWDTMEWKANLIMRKMIPIMNIVLPVGTMMRGIMKRGIITAMPGPHGRQHGASAPVWVLDLEVLAWEASEVQALERSVTAHPIIHLAITTLDPPIILPCILPCILPRFSSPLRRLCIFKSRTRVNPSQELNPAIGIIAGNRKAIIRRCRNARMVGNRLRPRHRTTAESKQ